MAGKLAPTTFATSAEESLIAVDAYTVDTANKVKNSLPDVNALMSVAGLAGLRGGNLSAGLSLLTAKNGGGLQVNADSLLKGIVGANPALNSAIAGLSSSVKGAITGITGYSQVSATINGITTSIGNTNLSDLRSVGNLIGGLTNTAYPIQFNDIRGLTNLTTNIVKQAVNMGMPDAFKSISDGFGSTNFAVMAAVTRDLAPVIINRSAVNLLSNATQSPYSSQLKAARPSFIQDFSQGYQAQPLQRTNTYLPTLRTVDTSFRAIEPTYTKSRAFGGPTAGTLNLGRATVVSDDFDRLLKANANFASVPVPASNFATMDTSCRAVASTPNLPFNMDLAQMSALKTALPSVLLQAANDPRGSLQAMFPTLYLG